jgi:hypothetical protein
MYKEKKRLGYQIQNKFGPGFSDSLSMPTSVYSALYTGAHLGLQPQHTAICVFCGFYFSKRIDKTYTDPSRSPMFVPPTDLYIEPFTNPFTFNVSN